MAPSEVHRIKRLDRAIKTTLQQISIPALNTIINAKMGAVSDFIEQSKKPREELSSAHAPLKELITSFTQEEIRNAFLISLEDKFFKDMVHEDLSKVEFNGGSVPEEICIELGQDAGLIEDDVRNYLYKICNLLPQEVRKARVLQYKTFISIPDNRLRECLKAMRAKPISRKQHKMYLVKDVRPSGTRKPGVRAGGTRRSDGRASGSRKSGGLRRKK